MKKLLKNLFSKISFRMFKKKEEILRKIEMPKEFWY
jgi:hypothetical protein